MDQGTHLDECLVENEWTELSGFVTLLLLINSYHIIYCMSIVLVKTYIDRVATLEQSLCILLPEKYAYVNKHAKLTVQLHKWMERFWRWVLHLL